MRIVVTGATGNIGTAVLRALAADDDHEVVGLARRLPRGTVPGTDGVDWRSVDLTEHESIPVLTHLFEGAHAVVHLAWGFQPSHDEGYLQSLGVGGTARVAEAVRRSGVPHLVHMSSLGAYSPKHDDSPVDESWPTGGIPTSQYSRHKAAAESFLDDFERRCPDVTVTRLRPGIVGQRSAGSALLRYGVPGLVPSRLLGHVPVLPMDKRLVVPMVHADDVADAVLRVLHRQAGGPFNLAADPPMTAARIADVLGARLVHVPSSVIRPVMSAAWHAHLQQVDTGWLDMGFAVPTLDTGRARRELGWEPRVPATDVLAEVLDGMRQAVSGGTPVLRRRSVAQAARDALDRGPVGQRTRP